MFYNLKKLLITVKRIIFNLRDLRLLFYNKSIKPNGTLLVIHESQELGASILTLRIAEELMNCGEPTYIVSRQFGKMNAKFNRIAPTQIALSKNRYKKICDRLYKKGYKKAVMVTAATGDLVKVTKQSGFQVVSMIHELKQVITQLRLEKETEEMINYSDKVIFSTSVAKKQIFELLNIHENEKTIIRPQGTYFKKPSDAVVKKERDAIFSRFPELEKKVIIAGIGNTTHRKGFDMFVKLAKNNREYAFVWVGPKEKYFSTVISNSNPKNFYYLGNMNSNQLSGVYSMTDVYLMCSRYDTLPSTLLESILFNVPAVGWKDSGGIIDLIGNDSGLLVDSYEITDFSDAIKNVAKNRNKLSENIANFDKRKYIFSDYVSFIRSCFKY